MSTGGQEKALAAAESAVRNNPTNKGEVMLRYRELKDAWQEFLTLTGTVPQEFEQYLPHFCTAYEQLYPGLTPITDQSHQSQSGDRGVEPLTQLADQLLLIWLYDKLQTQPAVLAEQFGLTPAQTNDWIAYLLPVWQLTLDNLTNSNLTASCIQFLHFLNSYQVEYLIVGGHAVAFHGYRRPLLDLDIFISTHHLNAQRLVQVLQAFGQEVAAQAAEIFQMPDRVIQLGQPPFTIERFAPQERKIQIGAAPKQLEILTAISAVTFTECYQARVTGIIHDVPVPIIGLAHLKRNKQASIRQKDADDLAHLR